MGRFIIGVLAALSLCLGIAAAEPTPNSLFLDGDFDIEVLASGEAVISWNTLEPCPNGTLWTGLVPDDANPAFARYRLTAGMESEGDMTMEHRASFDVTNYERSLYDVASLVTNGGGTIHLRLITWNPQTNSNETFHTRFSYMRDDEGNARRVPCITLGPVVDWVTDSTAVISWDTDLPVDWRVNHSSGYHVSFGMRVFERSEAPGTHAEVTLDGLAPDSEIEYTVELIDPATGNPLPTRTYTFHTAPARGSDTPFTVALMSDSRAGRGGGFSDVESTNWSAVRELMTMSLRRGADLIIFAGDLVNGYNASVLDQNRQFQSWRDATAPIGSYVPIYEGVGNHEYVGHTSPENPWRITHSYTDERAPELIFSENFVNPTNGPGPENVDGAPPYAETVYSFDWGNAHFVSINSNYMWSSRPGSADFPGNREGYIMDGQLAWLDADLAAAREAGQEHLFVYCHEPMFPNGGHVGDSMYWNGRIPEVLEMRARLAEILSRHGVLAIMHADEHNYSRLLVTNELCATVDRPFWHLISGGAGAPFYGQDPTVPWADEVESFSTQNHVLLLNIDGDDVVLQVVSRSGQVLEEVNLTDRIH